MRDEGFQRGGEWLSGEQVSLMGSRQRWLAFLIYGDGVPCINAQRIRGKLNEGKTKAPANSTWRGQREGRRRTFCPIRAANQNVGIRVSEFTRQRFHCSPQRKRGTGCLFGRYRDSIELLRVQGMGMTTQPIVSCFRPDRGKLRSRCP